MKPKELHDAGGVTLDTRWKALADALNMPLDQLATRILHADECPAASVF
jgi:cell division protein FtsI (penicillin-binding protein 3)